MTKLEEWQEVRPDANSSNLNLLEIASAASTSRSPMKKADESTEQLSAANALAARLGNNELNASLEIIRNLVEDAQGALTVLRLSQKLKPDSDYELQLLTRPNRAGKEELVNVDIVSKRSGQHHRIEAGTGQYSRWLDVGTGQLLSEQDLERAAKLSKLLNTHKLNESLRSVKALALEPDVAFPSLLWIRKQETGSGLSLNLLTHKTSDGQTVLRQVDIVSPYNHDRHRVEMESGRYTLLRAIGDKRGDHVLAPRAAAAFQAAFDEADRTGLEIEINSSWRSYKDQTRLYKNLRGLSPVAAPGTSMHEAGLAVDVQNYREARPYLERQGWYWPNLPKDPWHFEYWR
ncbi:MAG: M15 family metallopeptidase [Candidatus Obscuribacter sp.]|nr:M15 family metallopeptidase [Candidatus Obscuribacter sp.]